LDHLSSNLFLFQMENDFENSEIFWVFRELSSEGKFM